MTIRTKTQRKQKGVALIVVLLLLAIMATIAAQMSERLFIQFHRAENQINHQQAYWYSIGVEALAKAGIEEAYKDGDTINLSQMWATEETTYPLDYGEALGSVRDKQACFNLNALSNIEPQTDPSQRPFLVKVWINLLESVDVENYLAEVIADSSWEFMDEDDVVRSATGVEDSTYQSFKPAYLAPNGWIADVSELRAINGVTADVFMAVSPFVCAIPSANWYLNVNTIQPEQAKILVALFSPNLSDSDAQEVLENRPFDGWDSVDDFLAESEISQVDEKIKQEAKVYLSVDSQFFELDAQVLVEDSRVRVRSLLHSSDKKVVNVIRRQYGGMNERTSDNKAE
ncbi:MULTISPECIES: type II secretion system minor pseudopilin GspK [unclassified Aliivibrio]|uniref:type II secretion system minor pseudopilin GspK n=1 Tax=unclassified Aliivibrio TaxID=2645654 RepID=UPI00080E4E91|nr:MULTISPECIES: type II secretion system minor pseudopilin GspK [unclassified Aliivibrio]OCH14414.1 general secretion pathway protein GspK [Aliivibrio sp. 1S165]OCH20650.1 general secretion pathway protein GspK [Aliivibrio sp. 1S128]OCH34240.1 general secretion pathway protein GspK [Aliivibrio sp. 1S175]